MLCFSRAPWSLYLCQLRTWSYVECHPAWESRNPVPFLHGWPVGITVPTHPTAHTTKPQALPLRVQVLGSNQRSHGPLPFHASNATVFPKALNSLYLLVITQKIQKGKKKKSKLKSPVSTKEQGKPAWWRGETPLSHKSTLLTTAWFWALPDPGWGGSPHPSHSLTNVSSAETASPPLSPPPGLLRGCIVDISLQAHSMTRS